MMYSEIDEVELRSRLGPTCLVASLVATAMVVALWVRSYSTGDSYYWMKLKTGSSELTWRRGGIQSGLGGLGLSLEYRFTDDPALIESERRRLESPGIYRTRGYQTFSGPRYPIRWGANDGPLSSLGFHWRHTVSYPDGVYRRRLAAVVPYWLLFALSAGYPMWRYIAGVLRRQREDREALGLCPRCGVPVRSDCARCPGCDRVVPVATQG
jgi:hypothetical protein